MKNANESKSRMTSKGENPSLGPAAAESHAESKRVVAAVLIAADTSIGTSQSNFSGTKLDGKLMQGDPSPPGPLGGIQNNSHMGILDSCNNTPPSHKLNQERNSSSKKQAC